MQTPFGVREGGKLCAGSQKLIPAELSDQKWMDARRRAEWDLQFDVYVSGSTSVARISGRATLLKNMFMDMQNLRIDVTRLSEWDAALWTKSRVNSGAKSA